MFHFQNKLLTSNKYKQLKENKNISISNFFNKIVQKSERLKKVGFIISSVVIEIYIYAMFCIFFFVCCNSEINFLMNIKLWIFLLVVGGYIQKTHTSFENIKVALKINYVLIGYCCLSSFIVYGYQLFCLDFFGIYEEIKSSDNIFIKNLSSFGLINYENKNLLYKLMPHFLSNFLSILLYNVMHFIYERIDKEKDEKDVKIIEEKNNEKDEIIIEDNNTTNVIDKKMKKILLINLRRSI